MKISILMLTYNAPKYVYETITTLRKVTKTHIPYELIVVDNASKLPTRLIVKYLYSKGLIDKVKFNDKNELFAGGNNTASKLSSPDSTHYLLLNSDIRIISPDWLDRLVSIYPKNGGACSFGAVRQAPTRSDGYCLLIDRNLYDQYKLDEQFQWWWSVTKLEGQLIQKGYDIVAVDNHEEMIHHYGGRSGKGFANAKGMDVDMQTIQQWFADGSEHVTILDHLPIK